MRRLSATHVSGTSLALRCSALLVIAVAVSETRSVIRTEQSRLEKEGSEALATLTVGGEFVQPASDPTVIDKTFNNYYPLGEENSSSCVEDKHDLIIDLDQCKEAAIQSNAGFVSWKCAAGDTCSNGGVNIGESQWDYHPQGCFAWPCIKGSGVENEWASKSGICYYFNPYQGDTTATSKGYPICYAAHYVNGTELTGTPAASDANKGCPVDYNLIVDEQRCIAVAAIMEHCLGGNFRVGIDGKPNATAHHDFPEGCFISTDPTASSPAEQCFYFNDISMLGGSTPTRPFGIPICNATVTGHQWPDNFTTTGGGSYYGSQAYCPNCTR